MPFGEVRLIPGVNVERTPTLLEAGVAQSQLIRYKDGLVQKLGGWQKFYPNAVPGVPRDLHAWEDLNGTNHLGMGSTTQLAVITGGVYQDITPQILTSDFAPNISATAGTTTVSITDPNISNVTIYDSVFFNVPVSQGGIVLSGLYPITLIGGAHTFNIAAATAAATTALNPNATNASTIAGGNTLNFTATPSWVVANMVVSDIIATTAIPAGAIVSSVTGTTVVISTTVASPGVGSGDNIVFSSVPVFTATSGSANVSVYLNNHGLAAGATVIFPVSTTGNGVTIVGAYTVISVTDANNFSITVANQASTSGVFVMNNGKAELIYYINLGPPAIGAGYGLGTYGSGGYGTGVTGSSQTGTEITATDWTMDNWGQILMACPRGGGVYEFNPIGGFANAGLVPNAPIFNNGMFISNSQQIMFVWGSTAVENIGVELDPMLIAWCDSGNFSQWTPLTTNQAGNFRIPIGSKIMGGMAVANQNLFWTDLDLWAANYQGQPFVYGFNKIGAGAGLISSHAAQQLRGNVYWMGPSNFYGFTGSGVSVIPCPVWDFVFQNMNTSFVQNVRALPNTPYNEAGWEFPSAASANGENDSYVKFNITDPGAPWDYGSLARSAWIDQTVLGNPIGASPTGIIYQHETSNDADGQPMLPAFTTGYFYIAEGEDYAFVDQIYPDFRWSFFGAAQTAQIQLTFNVTNYPVDAPTSYGPYTVTQSTEYVSVRFRGALMSITVASSDVGSFWRLGKVRYRYAAAGRR